MNSTLTYHQATPAQLLRLAVGFTLGATILNLVITLVATSFFGAQPDFPGMHLSGVLLSTVVGMAGGFAVYAALRRFTHRPAEVFLALTMLVLLVTFVPVILAAYEPLLGVVANAATLLTLTVLHFVAAGGVLWGVFVHARG